MQQLGLYLVQPALALLPLGQIAHKADELPLALELHLADEQLHGKRAAVLALADHDARGSDDVPFAGREIALQVAVVLLPVWCRHQHADVMALHLLGGETEQPLRRGAERLDDPALVDDHHRIGNGFQNRPQVRLAAVQLRDQIANNINGLLGKLAAAGAEQTGTSVL